MGKRQHCTVGALTHAGACALDQLRFRPGVDPSMWWHDLPPRTRDQLLAAGFIAERAPREACNTHGTSHPGYVLITDAGIAALAAWDAVWGARGGAR